jgi:high-affinity iron transporter
MPRFLAALLLVLATPAAASTDVPTLLLLVDYVGVDYAEAVAAGEVVDAGEYAEMEEFAARIAGGIEALPDSDGRSALQAHARTLTGLIEGKAPALEVAGLARRLRDELLNAYPVLSLPDGPPGLEEAAKLYQDGCASCHGQGGRGDGPAAGGLDPPPIDFHEPARARERSLYGLYNTITLGVEGTGMAGFASLPEEQRWALAFYVGGMFADAQTLAAGEEAWREQGGLTLWEAVTLAPVELAAALPHGAGMAAWIRRHPQVLFSESSEPLATALSRVEASAAAYAAGDQERALSLAVSAYLEGFELAEAGLGAIEPGLVRSVEGSMMRLRSAIETGAPASEIESRSVETVRLLRRSRAVLEGGSLTSGVAFTGSFFILAREGLEAILILGAIATFLIKIGRRQAMIYLHLGWIGALVAGLATWAAATWVIEVSGAAREVTEGVTALVAAGVLFYVGFWMHHRLNAQRWSQFLRQRVEQALGGRAAIGLALVSFVAVYREVFETVLFYQALWVQVERDSRGALLAGAAVGVVVLLGLSWVVLRLGVRLPLRRFFALSGAALFTLAVIFAGKGIVALQEAGRIAMSPVDIIPRVELLGIYPSLQGLSVQLLLLSAALTIVWWSRRGERESS